MTRLTQFPGQSKLIDIKGTGSSLLELIADPDDGTSTAYVRVNRDTSTTGSSGLQVLRGNGTATSSHVLYGLNTGTGADDALLCLNGGSLGVGTSTPASTLHVDGDTTLGGNVRIDDAAGGGMFGLGNFSTETISAGVISPSRSYILIDTESAAATDDLDTITATTAGDILIVRAADSARTVVLKHGTGNLYCSGSADFSLDSALDIATFICTGSSWSMVSSSNNAA